MERPGPGEKSTKNTKKEKEEKQEKNDEEAFPDMSFKNQDATVTIDSSVLNDPDNEEVSLSWSQKEEKARQRELSRRLKELADIALIPYEPYKQDFIRNCRLATLQFFRWIRRRVTSVNF
ncbi:MAG: hypothetical protein HWD58_03780 [Bacteroidota bacterium]|nr:MAG: hypothetical protein HWD58_03780 [Bacteroidota bacterium]